MIENKSDKRGQVQIISVESLVPKNHLLRKVDKVIDFNFIYDLVKDTYSADKGRPSVDPVVLVKMVMIQHLFGIRSLRQTAKEVEVNVAYRWFLGFDFMDKVPHFSTLSYAFINRFSPQLSEEIFSCVLQEAFNQGFVKPETIFIDATHVKANANKQKRHKAFAVIGARIFDGQLREEINADRQAHDKKPLKDKDDDDDNPKGSTTRSITVSNTDPDSGLFRKGEHKVEFAYTTHTACDQHGFILGTVTTAGNIHDSKVFDDIYDKITTRFQEVKTVAVDAGYKTPWICKKIFDDGRFPAMPYKRPMGKKEYFKPYEYVYDAHYDCVICPNHQVLPYTTTNKNGYREFKSHPQACGQCPYLKKCTQSVNHQKVVIKHIWQDYIERAEDFRHSPKGKETYALRSQTIERVFADVKEKHAMRYTPYRGLERVSCWITLKFACMNLKKMALWA